MTFKLLQITLNNLNKDLEKVHKWATQWKINFNRGTTKQAQEVILSRKLKKNVYPPLLFNNANVTWLSSPQHLGVILDAQLKFDNHLK